MTYTREITNLIVYYWGKGLTAEETRDVIEEKKGIRIGLATVYRHRHSLTAEQIIARLFQDQRRDIALADMHLRLKYRDKMLDKLIPQRFEASLKKETVTRNVEELNVTLRTYEDAVRKVVNRYIQPNGSA